MKIFCIGRNYIKHAEEMGSAVPSVPMVFMKPPTSLLRKNFMYHPDFTTDLQYETELVIKLNNHGKSIAEKHAHRYYDEIAVGIDFTARDIQSDLKEKRHPWEISKGFDNSAYISDFFPIDEVKKPIPFALHKNGKTVQQADSSMMLFSFDQLIAHISKYITLQKGDLIFTGTPEGVGRVEGSDVLSGFLNGKSVFRIEVR